VTRRLWIIGGVVAGMLAGAATAVMGSGSSSVAAGTSIEFAVATETGAPCTIRVRPVVHTADHAARAIVRTYLANLEAPPVDVGALGAGGSTGEQAVAMLAGALGQGAEEEILRCAPRSR
jgi:xanthine/CO dehydrogenase XdhC/CoxF family maturation factor